MDLEKFLLEVLQSRPSLRGKNDDLDYGYEQAKFHRDNLDVIADELVKAAVTGYGKARRPKILDIGGGTGERAQQFADLGADVLVTALNDCQAEIFRRNSKIGRDAIAFKLQDVRDADDVGLKNDYVLINMRRVLHWMPQTDIMKVLRLIPKLTKSKTHVALCVTSWDPKTVKMIRDMGNEEPFEDNFHNYRHEDMKRFIKIAGYEILYSQKVPLPGGFNHSSQFFARTPVMR